MNTISKAILLALFFTASVSTVSAVEDITPQTREVSVIAEQIAAIQLQIEKVKSLMSASVVTTQQQFVVTIDDQTIISKPTDGMTEASARAQCETVAYNTDNMWKLVTCTFGSQTLYRDVFIAG